MPVQPADSPHRCHFSDTNPTGSPAVLLLHGLGATGASWGFQIPALTAAGFRVLAPDARGFGKSSYPGRTSVPLMACDMASLLQEQNAAPAHVVGISMGGASALQLALDHPRLVRKLVLVNTFASLRLDKLNIWLYFAFRMLLVHTLGLPAQARAVAHRIFPRSDQAELRQLLVDQITQADPRGYRATMRALARYNAASRLAEIALPTLVISAQNDTTVPLAVQARLAAGIPGARQALILNAGHAVIADQPDQFNRMLLEFLCS